MINLLLALTLAQPVGQTQVCDVNRNCAGITAGGLNINGSISASTTAKATASPPSYSEGSSSPLSQDLSGNLRIGGTINASSSAHANASAPSYTENTDNAFSQDLSGHLRVRIDTSVPVTGTFWQTTQPVSIASSVPVYGATTLGDAMTNPTTAVPSGAFQLLWNGTTWDRAREGDNGSDGEASNSTGLGSNEVYNKVFNGTTWDRMRGDTTNGSWVNIKNSISLPVTGTFWQSTQPISATQLPSSLGAQAVGSSLSVTPATASSWPVTGTFWQATQPVSLASMPTTPVTGTFWQATQPISATQLPSSLGAQAAGSSLSVVPATSSTFATQDAATTATGSGVGSTAHRIGGGAAGGTGNLTGVTVKAASTISAATDTSLVVQPNVGYPTVVGYTTGAGTTASIGTIKAASTAAAATDTALVVQIAPNQPNFTTALNVTAAQGTAANLKGTMNILGNGGATLDGAIGSTAPTNVIWTTGAPSSAAGAASSTAVVTVNTATNVKASAGNVYGVSCANANASICFLQFYNTAGSPTCGTSVVWSLAIPSSGVLTIPPDPIALANHATGIGVCMGTTATGSTACTTANACTIFYK